MISGIYQIENQTNGHRYVGSAVNVLRRQSQHLTSLYRGSHYNQHLQNAFDKYDEATLVFTVLEYVSPEDLIEREQHYLDTLNPEYNISPTAGSPLGVRHTDKTRKKVSAALMGHPVSLETRRKLSQKWTPKRRQAQSDRMRGMRGEWNPTYGKHHSEEHKRKISEALKGKVRGEEHCKKLSEVQRGDRNHQYGKHLSEEHRRKISEALKGKPRSEETKHKISESHMGKHHSEETRRKIGKAGKGRRASDETRRKLSVALKGYWRRVHGDRPQLEG